MMYHRLKSGFWVALALASVVALSIRLAGHRISPHADLTIVAADETVESETNSNTLPLPFMAGYPQPLATITDLELLQLARTFIAHSPMQTMAWAQAQLDSTLRQRMIVAVERAWGEIDPRSAVNWALAQNDDIREADLKAALTGSARQPQLTTQLLRELLARNPDTGGTCAALYAGVLSADGKFQEALAFINGTHSNSLKDSVGAIFHRWAQSQPQQALQAVDTITDPALRSAAFQTAVNAWQSSNPAGLAAYADAMPVGENRDYALSTAMDGWSLQDPAALAGWLNSLPHGEEFDVGAALMITKTDGVNRTPEMAMQWVENINNPALKQDSLMRVLSEWRQSDTMAAQQYVTRATWLDDRQRQSLLQYLASAP